MLHTNTKFNDKKKLYKTWDWWSTAYNCKIAIRAADGLNGKMVVKIVEVDNANAFIYMQPNTFSEELQDSHGILENHMVYQWDP